MQINLELLYGDHTLKIEGHGVCGRDFLMYVRDSRSFGAYCHNVPNDFASIYPGGDPNCAFCLMHISEEFVAINPSIVEMARAGSNS